MPWTTYAEAGTCLGVSAEAVRAIAKRRHWPRRRSNTDPHGAVEVEVPDDVAVTPKPSARPVTTRSPPGQADLAAGALAALEHALAVLRDQLAASTARADRLDLLIETERGRVLAIEAKATAAEQGRDQAEADVRELRAHAATLQTLLAEHRAALQGAEAFAARAEQAEAAIAAERARTDELQAGQELMMDMHARAQAALQGDLDMARAQATTAHDALKSLRQAETERKARGLLARLRAAVRGE